MPFRAFLTQRFKLPTGLRKERMNSSIRLRVAFASWYDVSA
jgi:hypothetical protein